MYKRRETDYDFGFCIAKAAKAKPMELKNKLYFRYAMSR